MSSNDEVERRGFAPTTNEDALSQSSTPSLPYRSCGPRSLEPIVRPRDAATSNSYAPLRLREPRVTLCDNPEKGSGRCDPRAWHRPVTTLYWRVYDKAGAFQA